VWLVLAVAHGLSLPIYLSSQSLANSRSNLHATSRPFTLVVLGRFILSLIAHLFRCVS